MQGSGLRAQGLGLRAQGGILIPSTKKENAPLFTAFVFTCIFIFSICTHVRAQGLGHCVCAAGVGFRDQGSIRLGLQGLGLCRDLYTCICIYICIYIVHVFFEATLVCVQGRGPHTRALEMYVCVCFRIRVQVRMCVCVCVCVRACVRVYIYTCMHTRGEYMYIIYTLNINGVYILYTYIHYLYAYMYICTHTHTHTCFQDVNPKLSERKTQRNQTRKHNTIMFIYVRVQIYMPSLSMNVLNIDTHLS